METRRIELPTPAAQRRTVGLWQPLVSANPLFIRTFECWLCERAGSFPERFVHPTGTRQDHSQVKRASSRCWNAPNRCVTAVLRRGLAHKAGMSSARHDKRAEDDAFRGEKAHRGAGRLGRAVTLQQRSAETELRQLPTRQDGSRPGRTPKRTAVPRSFTGGGGFVPSPKHIRAPLPRLDRRCRRNDNHPA